ncbi:MAG: nuclear transport factor 2 family protein [Xanthomonadales bacterium]|nr:nuclear transport factor 2 family protein [Xanthomonadales bacterium]
MAHPNLSIIDRLYRSFQHLDAAGMAACYADDAAFEDEVFSLCGKREVVGMWTMLCDNVRARGLDDWKLGFEAQGADDGHGRAHWVADYRFSATGRMVHNVIDAEFDFRDGLIVHQRDRFDFWRWSRQAFGPVGLLLGWTPLLRSKVRATAASNLRRFLDT